MRGLLFVIPGAFVILGFAIIFALYGDVPIVTTLFLGIKAAVLIIVLEALLRVFKKGTKIHIALVHSRPCLYRNILSVLTLSANNFGCGNLRISICPNFKTFGRRRKQSRDFILKKHY